MGIQYWKQNGIPVAELIGPEKRTVDVPSALELAMTAYHEVGASALLVDKAAVAEDFFILSAGLAGEILEKFIQYRIKMAVYGDLSYYTSKPLRDFIYRSNHESNFFFVPEREEAFRLLLRTAGKERGRMIEEERISRGELSASEEPELVEKKRRAHWLSQKYNETFEDDAKVREAILQELLGELGKDVCMLGPVRLHCGCYTRVGNHCFVNLNFTVQGGAPVIIGDHCNFRPNVTIVTPMHPMLPDGRRGMMRDDGVERFLCYAKPVTIGHDCWLGASVVVCLGATIGENCVIGAGSVVIRGIPAGSFAAGNPVRVIRPTTTADTARGRFPGIRGE